MQADLHTVFLSKVSKYMLNFIHNKITTVSLIIKTILKSVNFVQEVIFTGPSQESAGTKEELVYPPVLGILMRSDEKNNDITGVPSAL